MQKVIILSMVAMFSSDISAQSKPKQDESKNIPPPSIMQSIEDSKNQKSKQFDDLKKDKQK